MSVQPPILKRGQKRREAVRRAEMLRFHLRQQMERRRRHGLEEISALAIRTAQRIWGPTLASSGAPE